MIIETHEALSIVSILRESLHRTVQEAADTIESVIDAFNPSEKGLQLVACMRDLAQYVATSSDSEPITLEKTLSRFRLMTDLYREFLNESSWKLIKRIMGTSPDIPAKHAESIDTLLAIVTISTNEQADMLILNTGWKLYFAILQGIDT